MLRRDRELAQGVRMLLIDDNKEMLDVMARLIHRMGHRCMTCSEPLQVERLLAEHAAELDVVITDYSMPGLSGGDIIALCRREHPRLVTFLSTGYALSDAEVLANARGADGVLQKPLKASDLREALARAVESGRLNRTGRAPDRAGKS